MDDIFGADISKSNENKTDVSETDENETGESKTDISAVFPSTDGSDTSVPASLPPADKAIPSKKMKTVIALSSLYG